MSGFVDPLRLDEGNVEGANIADRAILGQHYGHMRDVNQLTWLQETDSGFPADLFFQMPPGTVKVIRAWVWVTRKPFRQSSSLGGNSSSFTSSTDPEILGGASPSSSGGDAGHTHDNHSGSGGGQTSATDAQGVHNHVGLNSACSAVQDDSYRSHDHATGVNSFVSGSHSHTGGVTSNDGSHSHNVNSHTHSVTVSPTTHSSYSHTHTIGHSHTVSGHSHTIGAHTHPLTAGIIESGPTGTVTLDVADDGSTFVNVVSGSSSVVKQPVETFLTPTAGDRRLRVSSTGLMRVQVLLMLDLLVEING